MRLVMRAPGIVSCAIVLGALLGVGCGKKDAGSQIPAAPAGLAATGGNQKIDLSWSASTGANGYQVLRGAATGGPYTQIATATSASYSDGGLAIATAWFYVVRATNAAGASGNSNEATATTLPGAPAAPNGLSAMGGDLQISLSWSTVTGATGYTVLRGTAQAGPFTQIATTASATYTDTGLAAGATFFYVVRATNAGGTSPDSAVASASTTPPLPAAPTGVTATGAAGQISIAWTVSAQATAGYSIFRGTTTGGESATALANGLTTSPYVDASLGAGATFFYLVKAANGAGSSPPSAEVTASTVPPPPGNVVATPGNTVVALSWTLAPGATNYDVFQGTSTGTYGATAAATSTSQVVTVSGLANGTQLFFVVRARNAAGSSGNSTEVNATPLLVPDAPVGVTATPGNGQVTVAWTVNAAATGGYSIFRSLSSHTYGTALRVGQTTSPFVDTDSITNGTTYFYVLKAVNAVGPSPESAEVSATPFLPLLPPTGLTAVAGNGKVTLTWTAVSGAASYNVLRSGATCTGAVCVPDGGGYVSKGTPALTTFADSTVANHTTYFYVVRAVASGTETANSAAVSATPVRELCLGTSLNAAVSVDADAIGNTLPLRTWGNATMTTAPTSIAVDTVNSEVYVGDLITGTVVVFAHGDFGNSPPKRVLGGSAVGFTNPVGLAVDPVNNELFVLGVSGIVVFDRIDSGNIAPKRTLLTEPFPTAIAYDAVNGELWVAGSSRLYAFPRTWTGSNPVPIRTITTAGFRSDQAGIAIDAAHGQVMTIDQATATDATFFVFLRTDNGNNVIPRFTGTLPGMLGVGGLAYDPVNDKLVATAQTPATGITDAGLTTFARTAGPGAVTGAVVTHGARTGLFNPAGIAYGDLITHELAVADLTGVTAFFDANTDSANSGNVFPQRAIDGFTTADPVDGIASDSTHDELWLASFSGASAKVYGRTALNHSATALRKLLVPAGARGIAVDEAHDEVYITDAQTPGTLYVYSRTADNTASTLRVVTGNGATTLADPEGVFFDAANQELYFADAGNNAVVVLTRASSGALTVVRKLAGPTPGDVTQLITPQNVLVTASELIVANQDFSVSFYPRTADGNVAPTRRIVQSDPNLTLTWGLLIDANGLLYVANSSTVGASIAVFDTSVGTPTLSRTITPTGVGGGAIGLAFCN